MLVPIKRLRYLTALATMTFGLSACAPKWRVVSDEFIVVPVRQDASDFASSSAAKIAADFGLPIDGIPFDGITLKMPAEWVIAPSGGNRMLLTKEGLVLQQIGVRVSRIDQAFGGHFDSTKKNRTIPVTPFELMELQLIELRSFNSYPVVQTKAELNREKGSFPMVDALPDASTTRKISSRPISVSGIEGFELVTSSFNVFGLEFRMRTVGVLQGDKYWGFHYQAPALFYFEQSNPVFDNFLSHINLD